MNWRPIARAAARAGGVLLVCVLYVLVVTQTVTGLQVFTQVQVLTRGGPAGATTTIVQELAAIR